MTTVADTTTAEKPAPRARKRAVGAPAAASTGTAGAPVDAPAAHDQADQTQPGPGPAEAVDRPDLDQTDTETQSSDADDYDLGAFTERQHAILDAMGTPEDRAARALLYREWRRTRLDPLAKMLYLRQSSRNVEEINAIGNKVQRKVPVYSVCTTIEGIRVVARSRPNYRGQTAVQWCDADGVWMGVWLKSPAPPYAARVGVVLEGDRFPVAGVAIYREYKPDNAGNSSTWTRMPAHMIGIAAEALALRKAFPDKLAGIYIAEELDQRADTDDMPAAEPAAALPAAVEQQPTAEFTAAATAAEALDAVRHHNADPKIVYTEAQEHGLGDLTAVFLADERATLGEVLTGIIMGAAAVDQTPDDGAHTGWRGRRCQRCRHMLPIAAAREGATLCSQCFGEGMNHMVRDAAANTF